jgi:hypothetical protein
MSRSLKKGPFVDFKLAKKSKHLDLMTVRLSKLGHVRAQLAPKWLDVLLLFITAKSMFQYLFQKIWSVINLANSVQLVNSANTAGRIGNNA